MKGAPTPVPAAARDSILDERTFIRFWCGRLCSVLAYQMLSVAVGWQVYMLTGSALDLGFVGLAQFAPSVALMLLVGHVADRFDRRKIIRACQWIEGAAIAAIALATLHGAVTEAMIFALVAAIGAARAFEFPTVQALLPFTVSARKLPRAVALSSTAGQTGIVLGPAMGGFLYVAGPSIVYVVCVALFIVSSVLLGWLKPVRAAAHAAAQSRSVFAGIALIRSKSALLGAISLDLFAVLLGGATALLPIFARDILQTGPWGLGLLRSAPAVGALTTALWLARKPIQRHAGRKMFAGVAPYGIATIALGVGVEPASRLDRARGQGVMRSDDDRVGRGLGAQRIQRLGRGHAEPASLPGGEAPEAVVCSDLASGLVDDRALLRHEPVAAEERAVVVPGEEARLLALRLACRGEAGALGLRTRLVLRLRAEREPQPVEETRVEPREHVALVLARVRAAGEQEVSAVPHDPRVVAGGKAPGARALGEVEQLGEAKRAVARGAGVRRLAAVLYEN